MPQSSKLFPLNRGSGGGSTVVDDLPPKIVLLDQPSSNIANGVLSITVRALVIDEDSITIIPTTPPVDTKPIVSWVNAVSTDATTLGGSVKVRLKIDDPSLIKKPVASWVGVVGTGGTTIGDSPVKIQLRIEE